MYLQPVWQKTPRVDLYLPPLHTVIEVKYRKDVKKLFQMLIGKIAEDASLYRTDAKYEDARIVSFMWDCTRATQEHAKFKEGVLKNESMNGNVVADAPSTMKDLGSVNRRSLERRNRPHLLKAGGRKARRYS